MGLDLSGSSSSETMTREIETWLSDSIRSVTGNNSVLTTEADDCVNASTDVMTDHIGRRDASRGGGCSKTLAYTCQFGWTSMI